MTDSKFDQVIRRPIRETDKQFLFRVFLGSVEQQRSYFDCTDEQWVAIQESQFQLQTDYYDEHWKEGADFDVIELRGKPIGRILEWRGHDQGQERIHIVDFTLLAEHRNQGIGSHVMKELTDRADSGGVPIQTRITPIELSGPFLERHGFTVLKDEESNLLYERQPAGESVAD